MTVPDMGHFSQRPSIEDGFGLFEPFNSVSKITAVARLVLTDFDLADRDMYIYER